MLDQYGYEVPNDLILLDWQYVDQLGDGKLDMEDVGVANQLFELDWYEITTPTGVKCLTVSWVASENIIRGDPLELEDANIDPRYYTAELVDRPLRRYSEADGFFHA